MTVLTNGAAATQPDPRTIPGAMEITKRRELADGGIIEFESSPAGWLTQDANVRERDWRAYYWTPTPTCDACEGTGRVASAKRANGTVKCEACKGSGAGKRTRLPSATTILDTICPKPGLPPWAEARGIEGAVEAVRLGEIDPSDPASRENAVDVVRALRLGADRARDDAATRGLNIHALLEEYMRTGTPPNPADHPAQHYGYLQALTRFLLKYDPEPEAIEQLVVHPTEGYAGRLDLKARVGGRRILFDAKTQENCAIYDSAHVQAALYEAADVACGADPSDAVQVVVFAADGEHRVMDCAASEETVIAALRFWRAMKPVVSVCEAANRVARAARRPA